MGKTMADQLRPSVCYWHSFAWMGSDMFGAPTFERPWEGDDMKAAGLKADVAFDMFSTLGFPFFAFHDKDVVPEGASLAEFGRNLAEMTDVFAGKMQATGVKLLWGTANLFSHPRYMGGAATNPDPDVFAHAAAQVKNAHRRDPQARRRKLRAVGRPRGIRDPAQHRSDPRTGAVRPLPLSGRRLQAQDRLQGRAPGRAEAAGAHQAPVRLRRRHGRRILARSGSSARSSSTSRSATRFSRATRSSTRSRSPPRSGCSGRSTPTVTTTSPAGTPTSSPTTRPNSSGRYVDRPCSERRWFGARSCAENDGSRSTMTITSMRQWLAVLAEEKLLKVVSRKVSLQYELAAVGKKADGRWAVRFNHPEDFDIPVVTGIAGSRALIAKAMGVAVPSALRAFLLGASSSVSLPIVDRAAAPVKQVITAAVDLGRLPIPVHHEKDGGRYLTAGLLVSKDPSTGAKERIHSSLASAGPDRLGILILPRHLSHFYRAAEQAGKPLEVAIAIGVDPLLLLSSQALTPLGFDEFTIASTLYGEPLKLAKCETVDLEVPAEAEIVLEGRILPDVRENEGPFGEYPKYYGPPLPSRSWN